MPVALLGLQAVYSFAAMHQIRYEELAESIRNPYWLEHRTVYDGISSNVGWYATVLIAYKVFGFDLFAAKFVRLGLHLVSLLCVAKLLRKALHGQAWLPLLTFGMSPTLLYFNTIQTGIGMDLEYAPICLALIVTMRFTRLTAEIVRTVLCWALAMVACLSYPSFLVYLPSLALVYGWQVWRHRSQLNRLRVFGCALGALAGFVLPLASAIAYVKDPQLLVLDPVVSRGLFRGGGQIEWSTSVLGASLRRVLDDLLRGGHSYYFELANPDLSGALAISSMSFCLVIAGVFFALRPRLRIVLASAALLLLLTLVLPNLSSHEPGMRRCTGLLAALYVIFAVVWHEIHQACGRRSLRSVGLACCGLLPLHHAMVYPGNLAELRTPSAFRERAWFELVDGPRESLQFLLDQTSRGRALSCSRGSEPIYCRYAEIFASLSGSRRWNGREEIPILAYDYRTGQMIPLSVALWEGYYFPH